MNISGISSEPDFYSMIDFMKAVEENHWQVFSEEDIVSFDKDVDDLMMKAETAYITIEEKDILEKAIRDRSKLIQKDIVDKNGKRTKKWVRVLHDSPEEHEKHSKDKNEEAWARHQHNTKVQRMSKEASFKHIERVHGKDAADHVRGRHLEAVTGKSEKPEKDVRKEGDINKLKKDTKEKLDNDIKAQEKEMEGLGYSPEQIRRASPNTRDEITNGKIHAKEVSILPDGTMKKIDGKKDEGSDTDADAERVMRFMRYRNPSHSDISKVKMTRTGDGFWKMYYDGKSAGFTIHSGSMPDSMIKKLEMEDSKSADIGADEKARQEIHDKIFGGGISSEEFENLMIKIGLSKRERNAILEDGWGELTDKEQNKMIDRYIKDNNGGKSKSKDASASPTGGRKDDKSSDKSGAYSFKTAEEMAEHIEGDYAKLNEYMKDGEKVWWKDYETKAKQLRKEHSDELVNDGYSRKEANQLAREADEEGEFHEEASKHADESFHNKMTSGK